MLNRLVADVFYDNGTEFIKFTNGKEILVETAWRWEWERVLDTPTVEVRRRSPSQTSLRGLS
ncbi:hypothetical protein H6G97_24255 [Nostoc flagelliforme FACHB-838]|uniref:Uncharacterized protein n=1 Tax=Nostoc flagelliforme FACHB-838 TaxID=2692904 RepID=A0ABR8DT40_9NOSO|nr:hypothetical protein [Nostoc flagelliforme FACHB-838]